MGPDRSRSGAVWVTATGSFLVAVAAALFVAVRWDTLGDATKLGILAALTGATLLAGESMRASLPATGRVLTHLGAYLAPLNVAAMSVHVMRHREGPMATETIAASATLATAVSAALLWWILDRRQASTLLATSSAVAVVVAAGAFGELAPIPGQVPLVAAAGVASLCGARRAAVWWAGVAGTAPTLLAIAAAGGLPGLLVEPPRSSVVAAVGFVAALLIGFESRRAGRPDLLLLAAASVGSAMLGTQADLVGWAALVAAVELGALWGRRDPFWARPTRIAASVAEGLAVVGFALTAIGVTFVQLLDSSSVEPLGTTGLQVTAVLLAAWLVADLRRPEGRWLAAAPLTAVTVLAGVGLSTHEPVVTALCTAAVGFWAIVADRHLGAPTAAVSLCVASVLPGTQAPVVASLIGLGGATLLAADARRHPGDWVRACGASLPLLGALAALPSEVPGEVAVPAAVLLLGLVGEVVGGVRANAPRTFGALLPLWVALEARIEGAEVAAHAGAAACLVALVGALRDDDPRVLWLLAATVPIAVGGFTVSTGIDAPTAGVSIAAAVVVATGVRAALPGRWGAALVPPAMAWAAIALLTSAEDPTALGATSIVVGCAAIAEGLFSASLPYAASGGFLAWQGTWVLLAERQVTALDAWTAPVAAGLVAAGVLIRRERGSSSWIVLAPGIALLGVSALVERVVGGSGIHALVAGAVGVAAVALGGAAKLGGPLAVGTSLLVALAVYESLTLTAAVPTWAWLALGGVSLIAVGIWLERRETGPFEAGQHILESMRGRYS